MCCRTNLTAVAGFYVLQHHDNTSIFLTLTSCSVVLCCAVSSDPSSVPPPEADQDEEDVFQPSKGNVAFGSASDGWAFMLDQFADMYSAKLGAKPAALVQVRNTAAAPSSLFGCRNVCSVLFAFFLSRHHSFVVYPSLGFNLASHGASPFLQLIRVLCAPRVVCQALWGDWCYLAKEKRVVRGSKARAGGRTAPRSMFEQFALEPIWRAYSVCEGEDVQVGRERLGSLLACRTLVNNRRLSHTCE